ncbi:ricin-type beta-trefoil lectin protein [Lentzea atacamensis]|uniref:Ricin-type beta-trefoil lectin protein n=2 Tax=Lentzea TaxID=165301 RepID=A0A316IXG0_9PSEU|nr:ricin-type beta-trefoil lectin domain protein [Lentzea atacamensis]PWK91855.1 ricin-type beta-trefoil lectin protein [Lentzea atacamensis]RAS59029.1 ricin-type beta-trefoil lectin protein [Lentzea atacamensis]
MGKPAAIIATAAAVTTLTAVPAQAEPMVQYQLAGSNRCLADSGTDIVLRACNETVINQIWIVPNTDADVPHNRATGNCLTATTSGNVLGQDCGTGNQRWRREPVTSTSFRFRNIATGKCLTAQVTVAACTTSSAKWNGLR